MISTWIKRAVAVTAMAGVSALAVLAVAPDSVADTGSRGGATHSSAPAKPVSRPAPTAKKSLDGVPRAAAALRDTASIAGDPFGAERTAAQEAAWAEIAAGAPAADVALPGVGTPTDQNIAELLRAVYNEIRSGAYDGR